MNDKNASFSRAAFRCLNTAQSADRHLSLFGTAVKISKRAHHMSTELPAIMLGRLTISTNRIFIGKGLCAIAVIGETETFGNCSNILQLNDMPERSEAR